ncbi:DUF4407 domain-containing protein [Williamwhitmania taraxaci]|uniref:DUF4407 domain-containing protein n=1 Tax=Williamwhitmania taraxaci TaxID=1640674 RepID=A0A1G6J1C8_9BACT|nr:DUF4407 domain-containing protein [Williamwhitmania taraxaci]SDC12450.1 protein of unknown function [Williamwhitmania taraxaci]
MDSKTGKRKYTLSFLYRVFCWCSGARLYLLERCPSDLNKYLGIGAIIFMTGVMASLSGGYAIFTIFRSYPIAIAFGLLWGTLIFFLDFFLVSSLKKQEFIKLELPFALPRFVLALLIAVVISKPIELKLFEREINVEIETMRSEKNMEFSRIVGQEFGDIDQLLKESESLKKEIEGKQELRNKLFNLVIAEAEGQSPTNRIGKGPVYAEKRQEFNVSDKDLSETKVRNFKLIEQNNLRITELKALRDMRKSATAQASSESDGFLARLQAMANIKDSSLIVSITSWFITLLFIVIESSPIIAKLLSRKGPYDFLLEAEEFSKEAEASMIIENIRFGHEDSLDVDREIARIKFKSEIALHSEFISKEADVRRELFKRRLSSIANKGNLPSRDLKLVTSDHEVANDSLDEVPAVASVSESVQQLQSSPKDPDLANGDAVDSYSEVEFDGKDAPSTLGEKKMANK